MAKKILFFLILLVAATVFFEVSRCMRVHFLPYRSTYNIQLMECEPGTLGRTKKVIDSLVTFSSCSNTGSIRDDS